MRLTRLLCAGLLATTFLVPPLAVADAVIGAPLLRKYTADDTQAAPGNVAITTGPGGELFVGNAEGVLFYDGVEWQLITLPGHQIVRSLATGADGLVYVGSYDNFGRLVQGPDGNYSYEELLTRAGLRNEQRHVGIVWEVLPTREGVTFRADHSLHFLPYDTTRPAKRWPLGDKVRSFSVLDDGIYARVQDLGFCRVVDGEFKLVPGGERFADMPMPGIVDQGDHWLAVGRDGLYRIDESGVREVKGEASRVLRDKRTYVVQALADQSLVVGTHDGELIRIGADRKLRERIDLGAFGVQALGLDGEGGLWAATEGELFRLSLPSPWSLLGEDQGLSGTPFDFEWHDEMLWLASSRGLSRLVPDGNGGYASENLPWTDFEGNGLYSSDAGLLIAQREGLRALDRGAREPRVLVDLPTSGVYALVPSKQVPGVVFGLADRHLLVVRETAGRWQLQHQIELDGISVFGLEETAPGVIWMGDSRGPVQRWHIDLDTGKVTERHVFGDAEGLAVSPETGTSIYQLDGRIHAVSGGAGFREEGGRFVPDQAPPFTLVDRPDLMQVAETPFGDYAYTRRQLWRRPPEGGEWQPLYPGAEVASGYSYLRVSRDGVLRIATWKGLLQYDPKDAAPQPQPLRLSMQNVQARGSDGRLVRLPANNTDGPARVPPGHSLTMRFAMVSMDSGAEFRYLLHGVTPEWSAWTDRDLFIRALPAGDYVLEVEARTRNGRQAPTLNYRFQMLPHWYEQWWMIGLGLLAVLALGVAFTRWTVRQRTERYLAANRRLEARIAERTSELEDANRRLAELVTEDALTGVANRRALENGLRREWFRCLDQRRPLSVMMIDVDHFKAYNDAHGHLEGDVQLKGIAQRLHSQHDPQRELLARYGGEEFALLLPGVHVEEATRRAESVRAAIASSDAGMTVSVGVAGFVPDVQSEPDGLLRRADAALYVAKRSGRNRVQVDGVP